MYKIILSTTDTNRLHIFQIESHLLTFFSISCRDFLSPLFVGPRKREKIAEFKDRRGRFAQPYSRCPSFRVFYLVPLFPSSLSFFLLLSLVTITIHLRRLSAVPRLASFVSRSLVVSSISLSGIWLGKKEKGKMKNPLYMYVYPPL